MQHKKKYYYYYYRREGGGDYYINTYIHLNSLIINIINNKRDDICYFATNNNIIEMEGRWAVSNTTVVFQGSLLQVSPLTPASYR